MYIVDITDTNVLQFGHTVRTDAAFGCNINDCSQAVQLHSEREEGEGQIDIL